MGRRLGEIRTERGLSLDAVEQAVKIHAYYLEALERGELDVVPNIAWAQGFLTTYATYLGLDRKAIGLDEETQKTKPRHSKLRRWRRVILGLILVAIAGIIVVATTVVAPYNGFTKRITGALGGIAPGIFLGSDTQRVLILGDFGDRGSGKDSVVVAKVAKGSLGMLSIPQNTQTRIPGHGTGDIDRAFSLGGPGLVSKTTAQLIGAKVPNYVLIQADGVRQVVDAMGGIRFDVPEQMSGKATANGPTINLSPGMQTLSGDQSLVYLRGKNNWSDAERAKRQQEFLYAMFSQALNSSNLFSNPTTLSALIGDTETNMNSIQMIQLAGRARSLENSGVKLQSATLPGKEKAANTQQGGTSVGYWIPDSHKLKSVLKKTVR